MSLLRRREMMTKKAEHVPIDVNLMRHCQDGIGRDGWLGYLNDSTGEIAGYTESYPTDFIFYVPSHRYEIYVPNTGFYAGKLYCYGLQKEFIAFVKFNVGNPEIVKNIPENAKYIRFVTGIDDWDLSYFKKNFLTGDDTLLGKLVNGALSYAPKKIVIDGKTIFNPPESLLKEQGYKDVETTEAPTVTTMTQQPVSTWTDQEDKIVQSWEIKPAQLDPSAALQEIQTQAILEQIKASDDKTLGIQCMALFPVYEQNKQHEVGEVATHPETGYPKECIQAYDGTVQQDWTIDNRTLWKPWHSRKPEYALPWEQPTGAHDMYKAGEYMIWTDGTVKKCIQDTNFSPDEYAQAWEDA